jgi:tetratricopeptide (TPR) repeat protein
VLGRETPIPGWMTDRGKMYIILGEPRDRETFIGVGDLYPAEVWFYDADRKRGLPPFYLLFFQHGFAGEYRLYSPRIHGPEKLFPAIRFGETSDNSRMEAYQYLQNISADLAHASITFRADESAIPGIVHDSLSTDILLADIYRSPLRTVDTSYVDALDRARGVVESEYLFNYFPSQGMANVLLGPPGSELASFVHWGLEIEPQNLTLVLDEDKKKYYTAFEIRGEVTTAEGKNVVQFRREEFIDLSPGQFAEVRERPFAYRSMFPLVPGEFRLRVVFKNRARNEYTLFEAPLSVPERRRGEVFLGEPLLLYGTETAAENASGYHAYQMGSLRFDPNGRRVFTIGQTLLTHLPVTGASPEDLLVFRLANLDAGTATDPVLRKRLAEYGGQPIVESLPLSGMVGGRYRLEVGLEDPAGTPLASRSVEFDVSPRSALPRPWSMLRDGMDANLAGMTEAVLAEQYLRLSQPLSARALYEAALRRNPDLVGARLAVSRFHLDEGNADRAIELLEPLVSRFPENHEMLLTLGDALLQKGEYARAVEIFEKALPLRGPDPALLNALGAVHAALGNRERARSYLEQSLKIQPNQEVARSLLKKLLEQPQN